MSVWLKGNYYASRLEIECINEDHVVRLIKVLDLDNPLLFDPLNETRQLLIKLSIEEKIKKLDPAFYLDQ